MVMDIKSLVPGHTKTELSRSEKAKKKSSVSNGSQGDGDSEDSVSLTGKASQISQLIQQMKSAPIVDQHRVAPVKEKVDNGKYDIEYKRVANKILDFESSFQGY